MSASVSREIHLINRPVGLPKEIDFELVTTPMPKPGPGEVLVCNLYMSVDPYMRGRMIDQPSYTVPFHLGKALEGGCVGQVMVSNNGSFQVGEYVLGWKSWREYYVSDGMELRKIDSVQAPLTSYLGTMGMPGMTAYVGLLDLGKPKEGETVLVSAASGAVGATVCQIAKMQGCRVVGSAGSTEKVNWLREVAGIDAIINYKEVEDLTAEVGNQCPNGIDVYFDNVGGAHLEAAIEHMNIYGRIALCGMISHYNATRPPLGPSNLRFAVRKRLTLQGFIVNDYHEREQQFRTEMAAWIESGKIKWQETVLEGIENAPKAFIGLFTGHNNGKMLVKLNNDPAVW